MLNLSKVGNKPKNGKTPTNGGHQPTLSLDLSGISMNKSINNDSSNISILNNNYDHHRNESSNTYATTQISHKRNEKSFGDSFMNDANLISEIFDNQDDHQVTNLDLTFEKSIEKEHQQTSNHNVKLTNYKKSKKGAFGKSHWNFGGKKSKEHN
mmetsp:Transcript_14444/g.12719  ORF Transcript_14444/g.12719 Transcript_14444/m.12719 type:complete len:154 (-) Transcript_14444:70-531(-)